jgi:uncharacterized protein
MDMFYYFGLAITGFVAGLLGALLGLGGGVFVVPALVLIFHLPFLTASGTSSVAVVATSTAGASTYVRNRLANIRLGLVLLISTTAVALVSSLVASLLPNNVLSGLFSLVLLYTGISMLRSRWRGTQAAAVEAGLTDTVSESGLESSYFDAATGADESYSPQNVRTGMGLSMLGGVVAGLLGVGGGIVQTPVMNLLMKVPLKVAAGTSNYMLGVTATSAAFVRYSHGDIDPLIAVPTALFVFLGARAGAWLVPRTPNARLKLIFGWVALLIAGLMLLQALGVYKPPGK